MTLKKFPGSGGFANDITPNLYLVRKDYYATVGMVVAILAVTPKYRELVLENVTNLIMEPVARGRLFVASPENKTERDALPAGLSGILITACVSASIDMKIRTLIEQDRFPVVLQPAEWVSGRINWVLDVIAPNAEHAFQTMEKFVRSLHNEKLRIHPEVIAKLGTDALFRMGVRKPSDGKLY